MDYLKWAFWVAGLALQYLIITSLLDGLVGEFTEIFVYSIFVVLTTLSDIGATYLLKGTPAYFYYYFTIELMRQTALYAVVLSLVFKALPQTRLRGALLRLLVVLAVLFWFGSLLIYRETKVGLWMTYVVRNISFCTAAVTLILWFILIASERRNVRLLMITGGLGLRMTGDAMGQSLRQVIPNFYQVGNIIVILSHLLCYYIWWQAFQHRDHRTGGPAPEPPEHESPQPIHS
jgi:hypothetical protein